ncbi:MAG: rhomboid family intramembrane serine protease, partial [Thermodesulfovibrionales bacterium]|nr:rhomboid family intramembrane serine protease [Thermodesulfovibrionales bacterium]
MIPYRDDNPTRTFPFVTIGLIVINCLIFIWEFVSPMEGAKIAYLYGAIPNSLISLETTQPIHPVFTVFTSMFLHGGFLHLAGN